MPEIKLIINSEELITVKIIREDFKVLRFVQKYKLQKIMKATPNPNSPERDLVKIKVQKNMAESEKKYKNFESRILNLEFFPDS